MPINRQQIIVALLLLWFCLTGSYIGWLNPWLVTINLVIWCVLLLLLAKSEPGGSLTLAMLAIVAAILLSTVVNRSWHGLQQAGIWVGYLAIYRLGRRWPVHLPALIALIVYIPLSLLINENFNVEAANIVGLTVLALPVTWFFGVYLFGILAIWFFSTNSLGAILALFVAGVVYIFRSDFLSKPIRYIFGTPFAIIPAFLLWLEPGSFAWRVDRWAKASQFFINSPLVGVTQASYYHGLYFHAHNILFSSAAETGLTGLTALCSLIWLIWRKWSLLPTWAAALIAAFGAWSLVDEPLRFWGVGVMAMLALGRIDP